MYERMLNKQVKPTMEEMVSFCGTLAVMVDGYTVVSFVKKTLMM